MRIGLILLLLATLALSWWIVMAQPAPQPPPTAPTPAAPTAPTDAPAPTAPSSTLPETGAGSPEGASFARDNLAELPIEQRTGFFAVQVWENLVPLPNAEVAVLPFTQLGEVMLDEDLWPFIITPDVVLKHGQKVQANRLGVVQIPLTQCPTYVAAQSNMASAMVTILPESGAVHTKRLELLSESLLTVEVRYANGRPVVHVPVRLRAEGGQHDSLLLGKQRRLRTSAQGLAAFELSPRAARILGDAAAVHEETASLAAALGYATSELDSLMSTQLRAEVSVFAGERISTPLPTPWDSQVSLQLVLETAAPLIVRIRKVDGTMVDSKVRIEAVGATQRQGKPYVFAAPQGEARLAAVAVKKRFRLEILMQGIDGTMERVVDGPQLSGEPMVVEFLMEDWPRVTAVVHDEKGQAFSNRKVVLGFELERRTEEISVHTDAQGRFEAFVPARLHNKTIDKIWLSFRSGKRGSMEVQSAVLPIQGMFSSFEDLGILTLK